MLAALRYAIWVGIMLACALTLAEWDGSRMPWVSLWSLGICAVMLLIYVAAKVASWRAGDWYGASLLYCLRADDGSIRGYEHSVVLLKAVTAEAAIALAERFAKAGEIGPTQKRYVGYVDVYRCDEGPIGGKGFEVYSSIVRSSEDASVYVARFTADRITTLV